MSWLPNMWANVLGQIQNSPNYSDQFKQQIGDAGQAFGMKPRPRGWVNGMWGNISGQIQNSPIFSDQFKGQIGASLPQRGGSPLASMMARFQAQPQMPVAPAAPPPMDIAAINDEYERIKAAQGAGAARAWQRQQMG